jgi:GNAT superfamily N-acetyltransferase
MLTLTRTDSDHPDFRALVAQLDRDLEARYGAAQAFYAQFNHLDTIRHAVVAHAGGQAVGCGAFRPYDAHSVEIKRMFVHPDLRSQGIAAKILAELERWAAEAGYARCILETGDKQPEAIRLYQRAGYTLIPNFGQYADDESSLCMEKRLKND